MCVILNSVVKGISQSKVSTDAVKLGKAPVQNSTSPQAPHNVDNRITIEIIAKADEKLPSPIDIFIISLLNQRPYSNNFGFTKAVVKNLDKQSLIEGLVRRLEKTPFFNKTSQVITEGLVENEALSKEQFQRILDNNPGLVGNFASGENEDQFLNISSIINSPHMSDSAITKIYKHILENPGEHEASSLVNSGRLGSGRINTLAELAKKPKNINSPLAFALAYNAPLSKKQFEAFIEIARKNPDSKIAEGISANPHLPEDLRDRLIDIYFENPKSSVHRYLGRHGTLTEAQVDKILDYLESNKRSQAPIYLGTSENLTEEQKDRMIEVSKRKRNSFFAFRFNENPSLNKDQLNSLLQKVEISKDLNYGTALAHNPALNKRQLDYLIRIAEKYPNSDLTNHVAQNSSLTETQINRLIKLLEASSSESSKENDKLSSLSFGLSRNKNLTRAQIDRLLKLTRKYPNNWLNTHLGRNQKVLLRLIEQGIERKNTKLLAEDADREDSLITKLRKEFNLVA